MTEIIEYISSNYTWFLGAGIIIVLAVIGYYADKTNFGQGKSTSENSTKPDEIGLESLEGKRLSELTNSAENINAQEIFEENSSDTLDDDFDMFGKTDFKKNININQNNNIVNGAVGNLESSNIDGNLVNTQTSNNTKVSFDDFDKIFNTLVPKEDFIDNEILEDIDDLSLDKTKKFNFNDIPDLDDVALPEIRETKISEKNIFKF